MIKNDQKYKMIWNDRITVILNGQGKALFILSSVECWRLGHRWIWLRMGSSAWCWFCFDRTSFDYFSNRISKSFFIVCISRFNSLLINLLEERISIFWWSCFMKSDMTIEWTGICVFVSWHFFSGSVFGNWDAFFVRLIWRFGFLKIFWI